MKYFIISMAVILGLSLFIYTLHYASYPFSNVESFSEYWMSNYEGFIEFLTYLR